MRRLTAIVFVLLLGAGLAFGQEWVNPQLFEKLGLKEQEISRIRAIFEETERIIREANIEIDILKAQIRKELFQQQVNMREVERLLKQSLDWELKQRMAQIRREVELRGILGDTQYARVMQVIRERLRLQESENDKALRQRAEKEQQERVRPERLDSRP